MAKLIVSLSFLLAILSTATLAEKSPKEVRVLMVPTSRIREVLKQYQNVVELGRKFLTQPATQVGQVNFMAAQASSSVLVEYFMGKRVSGDINVAHDQKDRTFDTPQNIEMHVSYPKNGTNGHIISYISIVVRQSKDNGRAYVTAGGVGKRYVQIIVEAPDTYIFSPTTNIYGY